MRLRDVRRPALVLLLVPAFVAASVAAKEPKAPSVDAQIEFGVKMAKRGLWNEALFRFLQASYMRADDPKILNNVAVAYEATGQYDEALESYQNALRVAPSNRELRANYSRFVEFYQSFKPDKSAEEVEAETAEEEGAGDPEEPGPAEEPGDPEGPGDG
jgi:tetratricopeptide (TPR) repeat protein